MWNRNGSVVWDQGGIDPSWRHGRVKLIEWLPQDQGSFVVGLFIFVEHMVDRRPGSEISGFCQPLSTFGHCRRRPGI